jgi:hypothetical protein
MPFVDPRRTASEAATDFARDAATTRGGACSRQTEEQARAELESGRHLLVVEDASQPWGIRFLVCEVDQ